jgi:hypothetical protein
MRVFLGRDNADREHRSKREEGWFCFHKVYLIVWEWVIVSKSVERDCHRVALRFALSVEGANFPRVQGAAEHAEFVHRASAVC